MVGNNMRGLINLINIKSLIKNGVSVRGNLITEAAFNGKTIINVDIQPEYKNWITFDLSEWAKFINGAGKHNRIVFLYNGVDTLGMIDEYGYKEWLSDVGVKESVIDDAVFYDKGYAYFRSCMDSGIDDSIIVALIKYMMTHDINDSRDIDGDMWDDFMATSGCDAQDIRDLLEFSGDMINIPDLMEYLRNYSNIVLLGGGMNECLKEVEIALIALSKPYDSFGKFIY